MTFGSHVSTTTITITNTTTTHSIILSTPTVHNRKMKEIEFIRGGDPWTIELILTPQLVNFTADPYGILEIRTEHLGRGRRRERGREGMEEEE